MKIRFTLSFIVLVALTLGSRITTGQARPPDSQNDSLRFATQASRPEPPSRLSREFDAMRMQPSVSLAKPERAASSSPNLALLGQMGGVAQHLAVQGNYAYMGEGARLDIFDISNITSPVLVSQSSLLDSHIYDLAISGQYAYVITESGLTIFDISNPAQPVIVNLYNLGGTFTAVAVSGALALVSNVYYPNRYYLEIINISDPVNLVRLDYVELPEPASGIVVQGTLAYIACGQSGLRIIDISVPSNPHEIGYYNPPFGYAFNVFVSGNYAYLANGPDAMHIINVSNPAIPGLIGSFYVWNEWINDVTVRDGIAYVAADTPGTLFTLDVNNPANPQEIGSIFTDSSARDVILYGNYALVTDLDTGLCIFGITDPSQPSRAGKVETPGAPRMTYVVNGTAYSAGFGGGLRSIDVSNPASMEVLDRYIGVPYSSLVAIDVFVSNNTAYLATDRNGLALLDVSNPTNLVEQAIYHPYMSNSVGSVFVGGSMAYVGSWSRMDTVNVSDVSNPTFMGSISTGNVVWDVQVIANTAYLAAGTANFRIVDVSTPTSPGAIGQFNTSGEESYGVFIDGEIAYLAQGFNGLRILDISNPSGPTEIGFYPTEGKARDIVVKNGIAYLVDQGAGLKLLDVSNPAQPQQIGHYDLPGDGYGVFVDGSKIYLSDGWAGLFVLTQLQEQLYLPMLTR